MKWACQFPIVFVGLALLFIGTVLRHGVRGNYHKRVKKMMEADPTLSRADAEEKLDETQITPDSDHDLKWGILLGGLDIAGFLGITILVALAICAWLLK